MKRLPRIEITELFMARADINRTFIGVVNRDRYEDGSMTVHGTIPVDDCIIYGTATNDDDLAAKLDNMVVLVLDHNIHGKKIETTEINTFSIGKIDFNLN